jgi:hypothetical protein
MTPQVCYLEKYLQIRFGDNTIRVIDTRDVEQFAYLSSEDTDIIDDYIDRVEAAGGVTVTDSDGTYTTLVNTLEGMGAPVPIDLYLTDEGTILYTSDEMNITRFVVQVSQRVWDSFSESITSTIKKHRLPGYEYILQVI